MRIDGGIAGKLIDYLYQLIDEFLPPIPSKRVLSVPYVHESCVVPQSSAQASKDGYTTGQSFWFSGRRGGYGEYVNSQGVILVMIWWSHVIAQ